MPRWSVYSREDCGLCEDMLHELAELLGPEAAAAVQVVDVDAQPSWSANYGLKFRYCCRWRVRVRLRLDPSERFTRSASLR